LFETLNKRIEFLYDRDHLLGHAYFLPLKKEPTLEKLNSIMLDNIVPLLQEYFHDDWEKIQLVL
jgi:5-methylcytosine-specific restriction protein B